jgi:hypothetical protein
VTKPSDDEPDVAADRGNLGHMSRIPTEAVLSFQREELSKNELIVLLLFGAHTDTAGICFPGQRRIAELGGLSQKGVQKIYHRLIDKGFLREVKRFPGENPKHRWGIISQVLYKRRDGLTPDEQIAKRPGANRQDLPIQEPCKALPPKPLPPLPKYGPKPVIAVSTGKHEARPVPVGGGGALDFPVF